MSSRPRVARLLVVLCLTLSVTGQQGYNGENRRTVPCTKAETARSATAFNQLSVCTGVNLDDLKKSFITQNQKGAVVGNLRIERVNECLWRIKNGSHIDDECRKSIQEVADEADQGSDTPSSKVAAMLMDDPEEFCSCVRAVNISGIECPGWGVVAAVRNLTETCDLLQTPEVQEELRRNAQQQLDDAYQEAVRNGTIDGSWVNRTNGSRSPSAGSAPTPVPPTLAPTAPTPQQPQSPSPGGNTGGATGGGAAGWNHQLDDNALKCFQKFLSACPNLNGKSSQVIKCAERAVKKGELDDVCLQIIKNYADPIGAESGPQQTPGAGGGTASVVVNPVEEVVNPIIGALTQAGRLRGKLTPDQQGCIDQMNKVCGTVRSTQQLIWCVNLGITQGQIRPMCMQYINGVGKHGRAG